MNYITLYENEALYSDFHVFPLLHCKDKHGKTRIWEIGAFNYNDEYSFIITCFGGENSKKIQTKVKVDKLKNSSTIFEQAKKQAKSNWTQKQKTGYYDSKNGELYTEYILPMLATNYNQSKKHLKFPCFVQPKLDGCRAIYKNGKIYSKQGNCFETLDYMLQELKSIDPDVGLDGEIYHKDLDFQTMISFLKNKNKTMDIKLEFHVFDIIDNTDFETRFYKLKNIIDTGNFNFVKLVTTYECNSESELMEFNQEFIKNKYEGIMMRNKKGLYEKNFRSKDLQKYKLFLDEEFPIINFTQGVGNDAGCVIWVCETKDKKSFCVRPKASKLERQTMFSNGSSYINKMLTVRFQELTNLGIPRFPVGVSIRDYE